MPVFLLLAPDSVCAARRAFEDHPALRLVLDHCGMASSPEKFDDVLAMARYPNAYLKWCHAPRDLSAQPYPWPDVVGHLKHAIKAFGAERIMWACDTTISSKVHSWAKGLFYIHDSDQLSQTEKEWILGKSVRALLGWEKPKAAA